VTPQKEKLAVLFADICGSTALYDSLGDEMARRLVTKCISIMLSKVISHNGTLIKTMGDEVMCTFPRAENAMNAACAMQNALENHNVGNDNPMHIRIGFHYGNVICDNGDVFGDTVNIAARIASITRAGQIMTTKVVVDSLPPDLRVSTHQIMRADLKGKQDQLDIFRVNWEADDTISTRTRFGSPADRKPRDGESELILRSRGQSFKLNMQHKSAVIGREAACDILVSNDYASRQHARIELHYGKFVIVDQSINGTFILFASGHSIRLLREDIVLHGSGSISLGQPFPAAQSDVVEFSVFTN
jgi:class 3 adenylate cyclase